MSTSLCVWGTERTLLTRATGWQAGYQVSIFEETGGGLTAVAHDRSLELFYDRYEVIARFVGLINEDPPPRKVLYLHGLGAMAIAVNAVPGATVLCATAGGGVGTGAAAAYR
jgi:hypothetical protein